MICTLLYRTTLLIVIICIGFVCSASAQSFGTYTYHGDGVTPEGFSQHTKMSSRFTMYCSAHIRPLGKSPGNLTLAPHAFPCRVVLKLIDPLTNRSYTKMASCRINRGGNHCAKRIDLRQLGVPSTAVVFKAWAAGSSWFDLLMDWRSCVKEEFIYKTTNYHTDRLANDVQIRQPNARLSYNVSKDEIDSVHINYNFLCPQ